MKALLKTIVALILAFLARGVLRKYKPIIVMVTGSVGKTSTKDAVAAALSEKFYLRASEKSYNSEFGVPLTIIGSANPWSDFYKWIRVFEEAVALILLPSHYPKLLVLEVGADRPGDLKKILKIATPDAVIVTRLPEVPVHVEAYASPHAVREEEFAPAYALKDGAPLVLSVDDSHARQMAEVLTARVSTYGFADGADVHLQSSEVLEEEGKVVGMASNVHTASGSSRIMVRGALGRPQLYAPAAALALSRALGLTDEEALRGLEKYVPPPGRCRLLSGKNDSLLIDDSYNASPAAVEEALAVLALVPNVTRRIAVVGDMLELGRYSVSEHERIGTLAAGAVDMVVAVGVRARALAKAAQAHGMAEDHAPMFDTAESAAEYLKGIVTKGDAILIKGSQSIRTERITAALIKNPEDLSKLVRQEKEWKKR